MAKRYGFEEFVTDGAIIFESESMAEVVGSSEWGRIEKDDGRRICAALQYFSDTSTEEIEQLAEERFPNIR